MKATIDKLITHSVYTADARGVEIEVRFRDQELERAYRRESEAYRRFGDKGRVFLRRIKQLEAATNLSSLDGTHGGIAACLDDGEGHFTVKLSGGDRLVFVPVEVSPPGRGPSQLDRSRVTQIEIWSVQHDRP